ncbi:MAG: DMT family transporter [Bacillota bacterium]
MSILAVVLSVIMGALFIIIRSFNMMLGKQIGIYASNLVNHIAGVIGSSIIYLTVIMIGIQRHQLYENVPIYVYVGGFIGATFVVLSNYSFSKTTVVTSTILILCGQFISSLAMDILILNISIKPTAVLGAVLIILGTVLYSIKDKATKAAAEI